MEWVRGYIGLPFRERGRDRTGVDCWGLVRLVYAERLGIVLPGYEEYASTVDREAIPGLIDAGCRRWTRVESARVFDVAVFDIHGRPMHVGLVLDEARMLHVERGKDACIERYDGSRWAPRLEGIYRHV